LIKEVRLVAPGAQDWSGQGVDKWLGSVSILLLEDSRSPPKQALLLEQEQFVCDMNTGVISGVY